LYVRNNSEQRVVSSEPTPKIYGKVVSYIRPSEEGWLTY
jgi:hypothetical protein